MPDCQVDCINKKDRNSTHEGITHLGGPGGGTRWKWPRADVITSIESGTNTFYTSVGGKRADVKVREGANGKYVQTQADGYWNDNLLALAECA